MDAMGAVTHTTTTSSAAAARGDAASAASRSSATTSASLTAPQLASEMRRAVGSDAHARCDAHPRGRAAPPALPYLTRRALCSLMLRTRRVHRRHAQAGNRRQTKAAFN